MYRSDRYLFIAYRLYKLLQSFFFFLKIRNKNPANLNPFFFLPLCQFFNPIHMVFIAVGNKNSINIISPVILQHLSDAVFSDFFFRCTSPIDQICFFILKQTGTVALPHIHLNVKKFKCRTKRAKNKTECCHTKACLSLISILNQYIH